MLHTFHRSIVAPRHRSTSPSSVDRYCTKTSNRTELLFPPPPPVRDQYPWPREHEDEPIPFFDRFNDTRKAVKSTACRNRAIVDTWDDYDSIFYNEWLKVSIEPMRFVDQDMIRALGNKSGLEDLFVELGMGNLATNPQVLYPELVR